MSIRTVARRIGPIARRDRIISEQCQQIDVQRDKVEKQRKKLDEQRDKLDEQRDKLDEQRQRVSELRDDLLRQKSKLTEVRQGSCEPSFSYKFREAVRAGELAKVYGVTNPLLAVNGKDEGYRFAQSHGIPTPREIARYNHPEDIDWSTLPDEFVLKTLQGASGAGVFPLMRRGDGYVDLLSNSKAQRSSRDVVDLLLRKIASGRTGSELVIEEFIRSPYGDGRTVPLDCKVYSFYGTVGMIMVRDGDGSRNNTAVRGTGVRARYLGPDGAALGDVMSHVTVDETLPKPLHLEQLVKASEQLSAALPTPFVRLDFYETADGIVFGEVTIRPGGDQYPRSDVDVRLGQLWEDAEARLLAESVRAGGRNVRFGEALQLSGT